VAGRGAEMMNEKKNRLLEILRTTSFQAESEPIFKLASGRKSKYYIDCKQALAYPEARQLIAELIYERIKGQAFDTVGGLEIGAYPIATSVSDIIYRKTGATVRAFVVRKEQKAHGVRGLIAGDAKEGDKTLIVDDVVTAGDSTIKAIRGARAVGLIVEHVIVLVDRDEAGGKEQIEAEGVKFEALCTLPELLELSDVSNKGADSSAHQGRSVQRQSHPPVAVS
jgi:orotate phosphoribosyltransferase